MARELRDDWDDDGGGGGFPAISWAHARPGDSITAIALPPKPLTDPTKGYEIKQRSGKSSLNKGRGAPEGPLWFRPRSMPKGGPILADEYRREGGTEDDMSPVPMKIVPLSTPWRNMEYFSDRALESAKEQDGFADNGLRRLFVDGLDITAKFAEALKTAGMRGLPSGATLTVTLDRREPNKDVEGHTNRFSVKIDPPTPDTLKVVDAFVRESRGSETDLKETSSPIAQGEEPPF
jgi:hypothetical protein